MPRNTSPTIKEFRVRAVCVPMKKPHQTASGVITESPLVLTDVITDTGISGHSIVFTYTPAALKPTAGLIRNCEGLVQGEVLAPADIEQKLAKRFRLLGTQGLVGMALAAIDMALWDALARVHSLPLVRLLGGVEKPVRPYGAVGYDGAAGCAKAAEYWATEDSGHQSQNRLPNGTRGRCRGARHAEGRWGGNEHHGGLQSNASRRQRRSSACGYSMTRASRGLKNRRSPMTTPGTRSSRARHELQSSAEKTGGERWTCGTPSRREHRTWSCQT